MDLAGEVVLAHALIADNPVLIGVRDARLARDLANLGRIAAGVQCITKDMRTVVIGTMFQKTARMVRDLSRKAGKQILFETVGDDLEFDRSIAEELSDPLLHMVRNSVDHGIESPQERIALGKDPTARIRIAAYQQPGHMVVAISDDGRGLNCEKILAKATAEGLVAYGAGLTEDEIFQFIFRAGLSTAEQVTEISGRGVGMDVVRDNVQRLHGRIEIQSESGQGTTFLLKFPIPLPRSPSADRSGNREDRTAKEHQG